MRACVRKADKKGGTPVDAALSIRVFSSKDYFRTFLPLTTLMPRCRLFCI